MAIILRQAVTLKNATIITNAHDRGVVSINVNTFEPFIDFGIQMDIGTAHELAQKLFAAAEAATGEKR